MLRFVFSLVAFIFNIDNTTVPIIKIEFLISSKCLLLLLLVLKLLVNLTVTPLYQNHFEIVTLFFESFFTLVANTRGNE